MGRKSKLPKIVEALKVAPAGLTQLELQRITGASAGTVHRYIHQLHDEGRVHIASWKTDQAGKSGGGVYQARYRLGKGENKPKPPALTPTEIKRRVRQRAKEAGELADYLATRAEEERSRYWRKKPARRDPLVSALFGAVGF
jgi:hypothetical protein